MTIGIDTRLYGAKHGGIGRYAQELIINLLKIDQKNQYVFFVYNNQDRRDIACNVSATQPRFVHAPYRCYSLAEQVLMAQTIKKAKIDLMHFPHFNAPLVYNAPFIATIHDLIIHHFPDDRATTLPRWLYQIKLWGYKKVVKHAILKAKTIIAPSEFTKKDILRFYNINPDKIKVVYEGVDLNLKLKKNLKFKIKNYLLYVGSAYPHKNLEKLIEAFAILRQKYKLTDLKLVFVGKIDYFYNQLKKYIISQYPNIPISNIIFYGYASDQELAGLYQNASLYVFPSLHEGFGLPPLEAMSFGLPIAASCAASIPEICGQAALYFKPADAADIAEKIYQVYNNKELIAQLRQKGFEQIKKYSWRKMAKEILEVYEGCCNMQS